MRRRFLALLVPLLAFAAGLPAAQATGTPTTLYFHAQTTVSNVDEAGLGDEPTMDANAPTASQDKVAVTTPVVGNRTFRKNQLGAFWSATFSGQISEPTVVLWAQSAVAQQLDVRLFTNGPAGVATELASRLVSVVPGLSEYTVPFAGVSAPLPTGLTVQVWGVANPPGGTRNADALVFFDSAAHPSRVSFTLEPLTAALPPLDDPIGIAFDAAGSLLVANAGTGHVMRYDATSLSATQIVAAGIVPGGFARGVTGVAVDGDGMIYAAVAETGEILQIDPVNNLAGAYARGLGTPMGIAFAPDGTLYVADRAGRRVLAVDAATRTATLAATMPAAAANETVAEPWGVAFSPSGSLAVSAKNGRVYSIDVSSLPATPAEIMSVAATTDSVEGLAYDVDGTLYVGDGKAGKILARETSGAVTTLTTGVGGPVMLAFAPGSSTLVAATQGEGRTNGDALLSFATPANGLALAAPLSLGAPLAPAPLAWVHDAVARGAAPRALQPSAWSAPLPTADSRYTGENGVEPTLAIQQDGDLFMTESRNPCSPGGLAVCGRTEVYRSRDGGITWQERTPDLDQGVEMPPVSADPYVQVDRETGRIFNLDLTGACNYLSYSDNDGDDWTQNPLACSSPVVDHQTIVVSTPRGVTTNGYPNQLTVCSNWTVAGSPCQRSLDGGDTFEQAGFAYQNGSTPADCGGGLASHLATDPDGRLFLPRVGTRPCISISEDGGSTWDATIVSASLAGASGDHESRVFSDTDGNLYYVWLGVDRLPYLSTSTNHGLGWSAPKMIAPPGVTAANLASVVAGAPGSVAVSYVGTTVDYGYAATNFAKASWNAYITVSTNALSASPTMATAAANPLTDPVKRNNCGPGRCDLVFDFLDLDLDAQGRPWATFGDMCTGSCVTDRTADTSFAFSMGFVAPLTAGPSLVTGGALGPVGSQNAATAGGIGNGGVYVRGAEVFVGVGGTQVTNATEAEVGAGEVEAEPVEEFCREREWCEELEERFEGD